MKTVKRIFQSSCILLLAISSLHVHKAEAELRKSINGAFGFKLGDIFSSENLVVKSVERKDEWGATYKIIPENTLDGFSTYRVSVDRKERIISIKAFGAPENHAESVSLQESLEALYSGYHKYLEREELYNGEQFSLGIVDRQKSPRRVISFVYWYDSERGLGWSITYNHRALAVENLRAQANAIREKRKKKAEATYNSTL